MVVFIINVVVAAADADATDDNTLGITHRGHKRNMIRWLVSTESLRHLISVRISDIHARRRL
jgi:hypothetical protein